MPGGISVSKKVKLSDNWDKLVTSINYNPIDTFYLSEQDDTITPPANLPSVLTDGTYRILDPATGSKYLTRAGRVYYDPAGNTLYYYAQGASKTASAVLDSSKDASFIDHLTNLGYNSSFTIKNSKITGATIRFSSNESKLRNNTIALTNKSFSGIALTLHANNISNSDAAGGIAKDKATIELSDTVTSYTVNLDGDIVMGDTTNPNFVKLDGSKITVDPSVKAGATAVIGSANSGGTYITMTFVNGSDGTYTITYNTANTLSLTDSVIQLKMSGNSDVFSKTDNSDIVTLTKELPKGEYSFSLYNTGTDKSYGKDSATITDSANRIVLTNGGKACTLKATGGTYEFKYEISTNRLSVYLSDKKNAVKGDCNDDGTFSISDVILLQKWLLAVSGVNISNWNAADLHEDGKLNVFDLVMMERELIKQNKV